jgi:hypothetical protein
MELSVARTPGMVSMSGTSLTGSIEMSDKHALQYRGVDWKKVHKRQEQNWAARSGPVTVINAKDSKPKSLCKTRKHDWEGEYKDGWLNLNCLICKVKNVSYNLSKRELECIENGWWTVNDLYIRVDKKGNVLDAKGRKKVTKKELDALPKFDPFEPDKLVPVIEEYIPPTKSNGKVVKNEDKFFLPAIPWKWTVYEGLDIKTYGYAHTKEDANRMANEAINQYRPSRA